jgi:hypothetical protein
VCHSRFSAADLLCQQGVRLNRGGTYCCFEDRQSPSTLLPHWDRPFLERNSLMGIANKAMKDEIGILIVASHLPKQIDCLRKSTA